MTDPKSTLTKSKANKTYSSEAPEWAQQLFSQLKALSKGVDKSLKALYNLSRIYLSKSQDKQCRGAHINPGGQGETT